jgi:Holliday junction DNA helicase RuvA
VIAALRGTVSRLKLGVIVLDVSGVGYLVTVSPALTARLSVGQELQLHTAQIVREDAHLLFGFAELEELEMFDLLRSVTGVGPKSALGIVASIGVDAIRNAVANEQDSVFSAVSGIGPKTAKLITVTLAGKLGHLVLDSPATSISEVSYESVTAALASLGWPEKIAAEAVKEVSATAKPGEGRDVILRLALARLGSNKSNVSSLG